MGMRPAESTKVTLKDIADRVNKSVATVSLALSGNTKINKQTRQQVLQACLDMNYLNETEIREHRENQRFIKKRTRRYCLVVFGKDPWVDLGRFLNELFEEAEKSRVRLEVKKIDETEKREKVGRKLLEMVDELDGFILAHLIDRQMYRYLSGLRIPAVVSGEIIGGDSLIQDRESIPRVSYDIIHMARFGTRQLVERGHRRIALVSPTGPEGLYYQRWYNGYQLGLLDGGISLDPGLVMMGDSVTKMLPELATLMSQPNAPTGFLVPCTYVLDEMVRHLNVGPEQVVLGCPLKAAEAIGLDSYPLISPDRETLTREVFSQLDLVIHHKRSRGVTINVPFLVRNMERLTDVG